MRITTLLFMALSVVGCATIPQTNRASWHDDDFTWIRGVNYVPSYAQNDVMIWRDFDPEIIDRELGYAEKLGLNSVRIFLQYVVYEDNPAKFNANFETFLALCDKHNITAMPVLFDSCFGEEPSIDWNGNWVMNPGWSKEQSSYWPNLMPYVQDVVGKHVGDNRIVMWDVMNEPMTKRRTIDFVRHWLAIVRLIDPTHPTNVGVASVAAGANLYADHEDVLGYHCYSFPEPVFRQHVALMKELSAKKGKPIILTEFGHEQTGQPYAEVFPLAQEMDLGWYFWELMIAKTQFAAFQGLIYPDGTCRDPKAVAALMGCDESQIPFAVKPDAEGVPLTRGVAKKHEYSDEQRARVEQWATVPITKENLKEQIDAYLPLTWSALHEASASEDDFIATTHLYEVLIPLVQQGKEELTPEAIEALKPVKAMVIEQIDKVDWDAMGGN